MLFSLGTSSKKRFRPEVETRPLEVETAISPETSSKKRRRPKSKSVGPTSKQRFRLGLPQKRNVDRGATFSGRREAPCQRCTGPPRPNGSRRIRFTVAGATALTTLHRPPQPPTPHTQTQREARHCGRTFAAAKWNLRRPMDALPSVADTSTHHSRRLMSCIWPGPMESQTTTVALLSATDTSTHHSCRLMSCIWPGPVESQTTYGCVA